MSKKRKERKQRIAEMRCAETEISQIRTQLSDAYQKFNSVTDVDALDACIYEISALRSRHNTAIKHYKDKFY